MSARIETARKDLDASGLRNAAARSSDAAAAAARRMLALALVLEGAKRRMRGSATSEGQAFPSPHPPRKNPGRPLAAMITSSFSHRGEGRARDCCNLIGIRSMRSQSR